MKITSQKEINLFIELLKTTYEQANKYVFISTNKNLIRFVGMNKPTLIFVGYMSLMDVVIEEDTKNFSMEKECVEQILKALSTGAKIVFIELDGLLTLRFKLGELNTELNFIDAKKRMPIETTSWFKRINEVPTFKNPIMNIGKFLDTHVFDLGIKNLITISIKGVTDTIDPIGVVIPTKLFSDILKIFETINNPKNIEVSACYSNDLVFIVRINSYDMRYNVYFTGMNSDIPLDIFEETK